MAIISRANTLTSLLTDIHSVSDVALHHCTASLTAVIAQYGYLSSSDDVIEPVLSALSAVLERGSNLTSYLGSQISAALDTVMLGREYQLAVSEETSIVTTNLRYYVTADYSIALSERRFAVPQSSGEVMLGQQPASVVTQLPTANIYDIIKVSLAESNINFRRVPTYSVPLKVQVHADVASGVGSRRTTRELRASPLGSVEDTVVTMTLRNALSQQYETSYASEKVYHCAEKKVAYSVDAECQFNATQKLSCRANVTESIYYTCPSRIVQPLCIAWRGVGYAADVPCTLIHYSAQNTTCQCDGSTIGLLNASYVFGDEIGASASISYTSFIVRWIASNDVEAPYIANKFVSKYIFTILCQLNIITQL